MKSEREQAYLNLINQLLTCPSGEEAEVLETQPELRDDGLVAAMLEEAENLRKFGQLNNANRLMNCAGILLGMNDNTSVAFTRQAEAERLFQQGNQQYKISQFREALHSWEQALTICRKIGNRQGEANCLGHLGNAYYSLGQFHRAIEFLKQSLVIKREIGDRQGEAASLGSLGNACQSLGQYHRAIDFHQQDLEISREIGNRHGEANSLGNVGNAYYSLGYYHRAIAFYQQSLVISLEIGYRPGEAASLGNLGVVFSSLGQYQKAIDFQQQSLVIKREISDRQGEANSLGSLGNACKSLGQYQKAIDFHQQSLVISREIGDRQGEATFLGSLGNAYQSLGQYQRAIEFHQQYLKISREIGYRQGEAASLGNLGIAYVCLGQYQRAIEFHQQYLEISREIGDRVGESISLNNLGYTFLKTHQYAEAETALRASIAIHETLRSELVSNDHKASIFETQISAYRLLQQVLIAQSKFDEALEIAEMSRTRAFVELLQQTLLTTPPQSPPYQGEEEELSQFLPLKPPLSKGGLGGLSRFEEEANLSKPPLSKGELEGLSIPKIQQIARERNSTIVEYSIVSSEIYIWVIQPNGNITHRAANLEPLKQQNQTLKQIILKTRVSIGTDETDDEGNKIQLESQYNRDETGGFPLLQLLHQILIEPIIDLLPTEANSPIIFIPHYDLFLVPFAALQDSHNRYLIENHTILTSPSIQVLEITREHQNRVRGLRQAALIVGDPTIAPKFNENPYKLRQIPRAKEAAEAIAATLGTEAISGENATKVAILDRMLNTRIVHLSAHGLLDDFQGSGIPGAIILAPSGDTDDGALIAAEILQLKLDSELVVLSACSTGRGKITGDGVIGLSRCFIVAGVPSIIVSLWNMGVISAKLLMTEFYQNLARGDNRAAALRCAMLTTKARFPSPIAWAAFTLIGETETLPLSTEKSDLRRLVMSLPDDATPEEILAAFSKLLKISEPPFVKQLSAIDVGSTDNINIIAQTIKDWCETKPQIEENLENEIYQMGAGGTDSDPPEEIVREFYETLKENKIRLGLSGDSAVVETDNSGTESVDHPT
ncbi:Tetratricopeptide TPR_1 repeat-containing protein [Oscillatoria nigro-viridis PCC 7112]|uniref:Tetratricopeptide TPR_1 repeat-containing protein n=1 Tax=Phormidium nigroviride PCC 7112 TaxID=179408 RepID=K9VMC9_9CYAN|nr:CHAT domain-containing protein [Oscillatoria nigro-viridis]AFZ09263.1 Tetratricopeptide TPR_1 repeat-containing protein [Oscillatoria nigro-viridis PCC 7112]